MDARQRLPGTGHLGMGRPFAPAEARHGQDTAHRVAQENRFGGLQVLHRQLLLAGIQQWEEVLTARSSDPAAIHLGRKPMPTVQHEQIGGSGADDVAVHVEHQAFVRAGFIAFGPRKDLFESIAMLDPGKCRLHCQPCPADVQRDALF